MDVVAYFDETAPGTNQPFTFSPAVTYPSIDDSGQISFAAYAGSDLDSNRGIWSGQLNQISLVALPGAPAPGSLTYTSVSLNDVEEAGPLAYAAAVSTSGGGTQSGNWIGWPCVLDASGYALI
jgi:hypothetical protein